MTSVRTLTTAQLDELDQRAKTDARLRANLNLHFGNEALVHRFVIAMRRGSYVRPHRHNAEHKLEMATMLRGAMQWVFFDEAGHLTQRIHVEPGTPIVAVEVPPRVFHGVLPLSDGGAFLEVKQGPYDAGSDKEFAPWAPAEGSPEAAAYLDWLYRAGVGEKYA